MEDKVFEIFILSNDNVVLGLVPPTVSPSQEYVLLDKPVRLMITSDGFAFIPWAPYAKDDELIPVYMAHVVSRFTASHPIAETYYNKVHCPIDIPDPSSGLVLPGDLLSG